jgi:uncharacterized lipoprotein YmbA
MTMAQRLDARGRRPRLPVLAVAAVAAIAAAGCSTPVDYYHTLRPAQAAPVNAARVADNVLVVGPVTIPDALASESWVVRTGDTTVHVYQHQLWTQGLAAEVAQTLADQLNGTLPRVVGPQAPWADGSPLSPAIDPTVVVAHALRVRVQVLRFDSTLSPTASISDTLRWTLECTGGESATDPALLRFHVLRSALREVAGPADAGGDDTAQRFDRLARAHTQALQAVADDIAAGLRDTAADPRAELPAGVSAMESPARLPVAALREELLACPECDLLHRMPSGECADDVETALARTGRHLDCRRCGGPLGLARHGSFDLPAALALTALIALAIAHLNPVLAIELQGQRRSATLWQAAWTLYDEGAWFMACW